MGGEIVALRRKKRAAKPFVSKDKVSRVTVRVSLGRWVRTSAQISELRDELSKAQKGLDPILKEPLKKPCLDHDHFDGRVRGVLSQCTNTFEGYVLKAWMKYVSAYTDTSLSEALRNMADYLEQDTCGNALHGGYLVDITKFLKRLSNETIKGRALKDFGVVIPEGTDKKESIERYLEEFVKKAEDSMYE